MTDIPEDHIVAYVDNELDAEARARLEAAAAADPAVAERIAMHRALRSDLSGLFAGVAEEAVPDHLAAMMAPEAPSAEILPFKPRAVPRTWWMQAGMMAACLVAGVALTLAVNTNKGDIATRHGLMIAQGSLAQALSTQLAADTAKPVRIALTFRDRSGAVCRTFWTQSMDGLACRDGAQWRIDATARHEDEGTYRQASSPLITSAAQDRVAGDVFDAAAEKQARQSGWKAGAPTP
jgi:hypothetical protein